MEEREGRGGRGEGDVHRARKEPKPCGRPLFVSHQRHSNMCNTSIYFETSRYITHATYAKDR